MWHLRDAGGGEQQETVQETGCCEHAGGTAQVAPVAPQRIEQAQEGTPCEEKTAKHRQGTLSLFSSVFFYIMLCIIYIYSASVLLCLLLLGGAEVTQVTTNFNNM